MVREWFLFLDPYIAVAMMSAFAGWLRGYWEGQKANMPPAPQRSGHLGTNIGRVSEAINGLREGV
jgi:hypothetical protein